MLNYNGWKPKEIITQYEQELPVLQSNLENLFKKYPRLKEKQQIILQKYALYAQYETIEKLNKEDIISNEVTVHEHSQIMDQLVKSEDSI
jgi:monovalent cation:H+ antiporter, CPA1 family